MSIPYPKIDTLFERGDDFSVTSTLRRPEFGEIRSWLLTEKVDGTNIRLDFRREGARIDGRTDKAQLPQDLLRRLAEVVSRIQPEVDKILDEYDITSYTLYGEGYGPGIQKGGGRYRADKDFVLFDVLVNDKTWLGFHDVDRAGVRLSVPVVPVYGVAEAANLWEVADWLRGDEFESIVAKVNTGEKRVPIEGVVARTATSLYDGRGRRIIWKLKGSDYRQGRS